MAEMRGFVLTVIGGLVAIVIGVLGIAGTPPVLALGEQLSIVLILAGLALFGIGPIKTAYGTAKAESAALKNK
jgi:hypothetical protein